MMNPYECGRLCAVAVMVVGAFVVLELLIGLVQ